MNRLDKSGLMVFFEKHTHNKNPSGRHQEIPKNTIIKHPIIINVITNIFVLDYFEKHSNLIGLSVQ